MNEQNYWEEQHKKIREQNLQAYNQRARLNFYRRVLGDDSFNIPSDTEVQMAQLTAIRQIESQLAINKHKRKYAQINYVLNSLQNFNINTYQGDNNRRIKEAINNILLYFNQLYSGTKYNFSQKKDLQENKAVWDEAQIQINNIIQALNEMQGQTGNIYYSNQVNKLQRAIVDLNSQEFNLLNVERFCGGMSSLKGELLEEIGKDWIDSLGLVDKIKALRTGAINLNTARKDRHSGDIIQDLLIVDIDSLSESQKSQRVSYITSQDNISHNVTIIELLDIIQQASNNNTRITINDNTYSALLALKQIGVQAKAGFTQNLWNDRTYNTVYLHQLKGREITLLQKLQDFKKKHPEAAIDETSPEYQACANYRLGQILANLMSISNTKNSIILTPQGFTTFTDRLLYLLDANNTRSKKRLTLKEDIVINEMSDIMNVPHLIRYSFARNR